MRSHGSAKNRARLLPRGNGLFDTAEVRAGDRSITFFEKPIGASIPNTFEVKTHRHTNLDQSQMLNYPTEFQAFSVRFAVSAGCECRDVEQIRKGKARFIYGDAERCVEFKPQGVEIPLETEFRDSRSISIDECRDLIDPAKLLARITPGAPFKVIVSWEKPLKISEPILVAVVLDGIFWKPL